MVKWESILISLISDLLHISSRSTVTREYLLISHSRGRGAYYAHVCDMCKNVPTARSEIGIDSTNWFSLRWWSALFVSPSPSLLSCLTDLCPFLSQPSFSNFISPYLIPCENKSWKMAVQAGIKQHAPTSFPLLPHSLHCLFADEWSTNSFLQLFSFIHSSADYHG